MEADFGLSVNGSWFFLATAAEEWLVPWCRFQRKHMEGPTFGLNTKPHANQAVFGVGFGGIKANTIVANRNFHWFSCSLKFTQT